jgi:hypothetical protein
MLNSSFPASRKNFIDMAAIYYYTDSNKDAMEKKNVD